METLAQFETISSTTPPFLSYLWGMETVFSSKFFNK